MPRFDVSFLSRVRAVVKAKLNHDGKGLEKIL